MTTLILHFRAKAEASSSPDHAVGEETSFKSVSKAVPLASTLSTWPPRVDVHKAPRRRSHSNNVPCASSDAQLLQRRNVRAFAADLPVVVAMAKLKA